MTIFYLFITLLHFEENGIRSRLQDIELLRTNLNKTLIEKNILNIDSTIKAGRDRITSNYLGEISTSSGRKFHIIKTYYTFNISESPTVESHILFYNKECRVVGYYDLPNKDFLPTALIKNILYFNINDNNCNQKIAIDFKRKIPRFINLKCKENNYIEFIER